MRPFGGSDFQPSELYTSTEPVRMYLRWRERNLEARVRLEFGHSVRLAEAVHERRLDLAYVQNWRLPAATRYEPLHHADFTLMLAMHDPLARKSPVSEDDVYDAKLVTAPLYSQEWPHYEQLLRETGLHRYRLALDIDGVHARLQATQAGLGVIGVFTRPTPPSTCTGCCTKFRLGPPTPRAEFGLVSREPEL